MELSRILGDNVTFPLGIPAEQLITVAWTVNTTRSIVTVAAGNPPNVIVTDLSYKGRLRVPENYSLQITNLRMEDTGTYRAQITTATGTIPRPFLLRVYKQVPEPTVVCDSGPCVNETCNYNLRCTVRDGGDNVTYSWTHTAGGTVVPDESILHISLSPRDAHLAVTCTAQNPASNSSTTASAKDLCAAPTTTTTTAPPHGSQSAIIAGILGFFLVILFVIIALWLVRTHKRKRALQKYTPGPAGSAGKSLLCPTDLLACTSPPKCIVLPKSDFQPLSRASTSSSIKYWVPPVFMVIALITLYFTYRKTTERDSDSQDNQAVHSAAYVIPHPEAWNQTHAETLQAKETLTTEENEAALSDPDPSPSQARSHCSLVLLFENKEQQD
ncbi:SLAM family member 5-like [Terrapene carolina triunguis]|uniref:SLAM family member 5-like n=1 Tax=Terrapene triunguis TaxID=2587831 RepID=UPI001156577D|nr:SLAM family member 5-like [Terrapene carolina triunguis]